VSERLHHGQGDGEYAIVSSAKWRRSGSVRGGGSLTALARRLGMRFPLWKVKRELRRFGMQVGRLPWFVASPIARRIYDHQKHQYIRITPGDVQQSTEVAILLIYQPQGLLKSTLHTLKHLRSRNISPLVVSNAPLSDADRARLLPYAWQVMERPNFGYDFGGYRDGILHILDIGVHPSRLYVLNDSIWFPVQEDSDLLEQARDSGADLFGFVLNTRVRASYRRHIQSYFFSFSGSLVAQPAFEQHWRNLFLTNNKDLVVRRCEIPMTNAFRRKGYSVAFRYTYADGAEALKALDNETLHRVITYHAKVDTKNARYLQRHLTSNTLDDAWRDRVLQDIGAGIFEKYFLITHPAVLFGQLRSPLLKKDRQEIYQLQRAELLAGGFDEDFAPVVRDEIRTWD
jgi:hypothetical protein